jgi:hypothetical protein
MQDWCYQIFQYWQICHQHYPIQKELIKKSSKLSNKNIIEDKNCPLILWNISVRSQSFNLTPLEKVHLYWKSNQTSAKCSSWIGCVDSTQFCKTRKGFRKISFSCSSLRQNLDWWRQWYGSGAVPSWIQNPVGRFRCLHLQQSQLDRSRKILSN